MPRYRIEGFIPTGQWDTWANEPGTKLFKRRFRDLLQAEQAARNLCRKHRRPVELRQEPTKTYPVTVLATVRMDASDRVWTDLEPAGATLL